MPGKLVTNLLIQRQESVDINLYVNLTFLLIQVFVQQNVKSQYIIQPLMETCLSAKE